MAAGIFDRETLLDLTVNLIPLFIIAFFVAAFLVVNPWGFTPMASGLQMVLLVAPFVALAVLTYFSAKAIAGDEKTKPVFPPGQTEDPDSVPGSEPELESASDPEPGSEDADETAAETGETAEAE